MSDFFSVVKRYLEQVTLYFCGIKATSSMIIKVFFHFK